jgi:mRNA interferase MazF
LAVKPSRGEVWTVNLDPTLGHEIGRRRPCVIVSNDMLNHGPSGLAIIVPMTTVDRRIPMHVPIDPPEGGVRSRSFIKCEDVRSIDTDQRLIDRWGSVSAATLRLVEDRLRILLQL